MHTNCFKTHTIVQHALPYLYPINYCYSHKLLLFAWAEKKPIVSQTFLLTLKLKFNLNGTDIWQFNVSFALDYCLKSPWQLMTVPLCGSRPLFFRVLVSSEQDKRSHAVAKYQYV